MPRDPKGLGTSRDWLARARSNLTEYAVEARYPGTYEPVTEEECNRAAELAQIAVAWVVAQIEDENAETSGD